MKPESENAEPYPDQARGISLNPNPIFFYYDRGLQEYGDLFSDGGSSADVLEENETAETQSHRL